jgi:hypothetical protein
VLLGELEDHCDVDVHVRAAERIGRRPSLRRAIATPKVDRVKFCVARMHSGVTLTAGGPGTQRACLSEGVARCHGSSVHHGPGWMGTVAGGCG